MKDIERKIDKLGRIVLPMNFRKSLGLVGEMGVILIITDNAIIIKSSESVCRLCGSAKKVSKGFMVCSKCINKIKKSN